MGGLIGERQIALQNFQSLGSKYTFKPANFPDLMIYLGR